MRDGLREATKAERARAQWRPWPARAATRRLCNGWGPGPLNGADVGGFGRRRIAVGAAVGFTGGLPVIVFGVILLIVGFVLAIPLLWTIGVILLLIGLALWVLGSMGHAVRGRRHYF